MSSDILTKYPFTGELNTSDREALYPIRDIRVTVKLPSDYNKTAPTNFKLQLTSLNSSAGVIHWEINSSCIGNSTVPINADTTDFIKSDKPVTWEGVANIDLGCMRIIQRPPQLFVASGSGAVPITGSTITIANAANVRCILTDSADTSQVTFAGIIGEHVSSGSAAVDALRSINGQQGAVALSLGASVVANNFVRVSVVSSGGII